MSARGSGRWWGRAICIFRRGSSQDQVRGYSGCDLSINWERWMCWRATATMASEIEFATRPTMRFHGSIPALIDQLKLWMESEARVLIAAPNQGEVERLAGLMQEYGVAYRIGSRVEQGTSASVYSESSYLAGDLRTPVIVRAAICEWRAGDGLGSERGKQVGAAGDRGGGERPERRCGCDGAASAKAEVEDGSVRVRLSRSRPLAITWCMWSTALRDMTGCEILSSLTARISS